MNHLELYKTFYFVARSGSITGAAEQLSLTQPAVSQSIKQLEKQLGVQLFSRTTKGIRLTAEGQILFPYAEKCYESIRQGEQKIKELLNLDYGEIRIGASDMTLKYFLLPYLERFHQQYPEVKVVVYNSTTPETIDALSNGKIDLGIVSSPLPSHAAFEIRKVREIQDIFVAGSRFADLKNKQLSFKILEQLPVICLEKNTSTRKYVDAFLEHKSISLSPEFELATSDMIVQFALRNLGIGCVMKDFALEALKSGELFELSFSSVLPSRNFYIIHYAEDTLAPAPREFLKFFAC